MTEQDWLDEGRPLGIPFTLIREVYYKHCKNLLAAIRIGAHSIALAVEQYRGQHNAIYLETYNVGEPHFADQDSPMYVAISVIQHPDILRVGATVTMLRQQRPAITTQTKSHSFHQSAGGEDAASR